MTLEQQVQRAADQKLEEFRAEYRKNVATMQREIADLNLAQSRVYKLIQKSYADTTLSDFDLPKTIGYFRTEAGAERVIENRLRNQGFTRKGEKDTARDYFVKGIHVEP